jgi:hypothetical protein
MKIRFFTLLVIITLNSSLNFSQTHQFYGSVGYNFPTTTALIGQYSNLESTKINTSSFSKGLVFQGGYSFGINENIMIDLNLSYLSGVSDENYYSIIDVIQDPSGPRYEVRLRNYSNKNISITPSIKLKTSLGDFSPYLKFGASINFITIEDTWINPFISIWSNVPTTRKYIYSNDYTLGWFSGIGLSYFIESGISVFSEFQINGITFYADEVEYNGQTFELKDEIPYGFPDDLDWAKKDFPFSSMGVLIGLIVGI